MIIVPTECLSLSHSRMTVRAAEHQPYLLALVNRSTPKDLPTEFGSYSLLHNFDEALALIPDLISICTHVDTHAQYAIASMESGAHVFVEKPRSSSIEGSTRAIENREAEGKKNKCRLHPPTPFQLAEIHPSSERAGTFVRLSNEPEPAISRRGVRGS